MPVHGWLCNSRASNRRHNASGRVQDVGDCMHTTVSCCLESHRNLTQGREAAHSTFKDCKGTSTQGSIRNALATCDCILTLHDLPFSSSMVTHAGMQCYALHLDAQGMAAQARFTSQVALGEPSHVDTSKRPALPTCRNSQAM